MGQAMLSLPLQTGQVFRAAFAIAILTTFSATPVRAISVDYTDDFNDNSTNGWKVGQASSFPQVVEDNGPNGAGDHSLYMATAGAGGEQARLVILNNSANWIGNWTAVGIRKIAMDVQNPSTFPLKMRLGIAGPEGVFGGGGGDTFLTDAIDVPPNAGSWQHIEFSVLASAFKLGVPREDFLDPVPVLAAVSQFRILHNPDEEFLGEFIAGKFYLDNITAIVPEPASWLFMTGLFIFAWVVVRRRE